MNVKGADSYTVLEPDNQIAEVTTVRKYPKNKHFYYKFEGWRIENTDTILQPGDVINKENFDTLTGGAGVLVLNAIWNPLDDNNRVASVNFYVNLNSEIKDVLDNGFVPQPESDFTNSIYSSWIVGTPANKNLLIAPATDADTAYEVDKQIRNSIATPIEGFQMGKFPSDESIFSALRNSSYTIKAEGNVFPHESITSDYFEIRWSSIKYDKSDGWHVDGTLVAKEASIVVTKNFSGDKERVNLCCQVFLYCFS